MNAWYTDGTVVYAVVPSSDGAFERAYVRTALSFVPSLNGEASEILRIKEVEALRSIGAEYRDIALPEAVVGKIY